jgi:hypothetical protein
MGEIIVSMFAVSDVLFLPLFGVGIHKGESSVYLQNGESVHSCRIALVSVHLRW